MKIFGKIILLLLLVTGIAYGSFSYAEDNYIEVPVGTNLKAIFPDGANADNINCTEGTEEDSPMCLVKSGFGPVQAIIGAIVKYFTFIATLAAVLFVVINGIQYSMSGLDQGLKDKAKERIMKTLSGIILLLLSGTILNILFPWIYK